MLVQLGEIGIRRAEIKDVESIYQYRNNWEVIKTLGGTSHGLSRQYVKDWITTSEARSKDLIWVVVDSKTDLCIGHIGLYDIDYRIGKAELGYCIGDQDYWRRGFGTKLVAWLVKYGFEQLNLNRLETFNLAYNFKAEKIKEKIGFKKEGCLRQAQYRDGSYHDLNIWAVLEDEWEREFVEKILGSES